MKPALSLASLKARLTALSNRARPGLRRVLAIATDGCESVAAVVRTTDGKHLTVDAVARSRAIRIESAAEELIRGLKEQGAAPPAQTVLMTASMFPAVLELPIPANKSLSAEQMVKMIRWELEPLFAQQIELWSIGNLLFGRGYLGHAERLALIAEHKEAQAAARSRGGRAAARFGELAIERGFVTREQVEECLALQEELQVTDADLLIGWHPASVGPGADPGQSAWLCAGIGPELRNRWVGALERQGQHLHSIYPLAGASAPLAVLGDATVGVELHPTLGACYRIKDGAMSQLFYHQFTTTALSQSEALLLAQPALRPDDCRMALHLGREWPADTAETLRQAWRRDVLAPEKEGLIAALPEELRHSDAVLAALAGGSAHVMGLVPDGVLPRVAGSRPPPPLHRRPEVWMGTAAGLVLLAVTGFEIHNYRVRTGLQQQVQAFQGKKAALDAKKRTAEEALKALEADKKALEAVRDELAASELSKRIFEKSLGERNRFLETLLSALTDRMNDDLLLESVEETGWQYVEVQGFALGVESVYSYARAVADALELFDMRLGNLETTEARGPLGLNGRHFKFVLRRSLRPAT
jgi:hypothetical protein